MSCFVLRLICRQEYLSEPSCLEHRLITEFPYLGNKAGYHKRFLAETTMV